VVSLVGVSGCGGPKGGAKNQVRGKVTLNGENVAGTVSFIGTDGQEKSTPITPDGMYTISDPTIGQVKIVVKGGLGGIAPVAPAMPKGGAPMPTTSPGGTSQGVAPPEKYTRAETTPLTYEVKAGTHTYDITLTR